MIFFFIFFLCIYLFIYIYTHNICFLTPPLLVSSSARIAPSTGEKHGSDFSFGEVAVAAYSATPAHSWYRFKKRCGRRQRNLVTWVAVYGDLFSMSLFFPALLIGFFVYSFIG